MTTLHDTLNDLEEKANKAKASGPLLPDNFGRAWDAYAELQGVCTPDTVLALITALRELQARNEFLEDVFNNQKEFIEGAINDKIALREAEEAMSMGAFHHNCCPWLNGKECCCAREKVDRWLAKYAKGEKG